MTRTFRFPAIDRVVHGAGAIASSPGLVDELAAERVVVLTGRTLADVVTARDPERLRSGSRLA